MEHERQALEGLLKDVKGILFDFDGPLCDLFAEAKAGDIAAAMAKHARNVSSQPSLRPEKPHSPNTAWDANSPG